LHTPQICGTCRGVKVGIHGLLNWTAENLYLGVLMSIADTENLVDVDQRYMARDLPLLARRAPQLCA
jgi:hypothetical protein